MDVEPLDATFGATVRDIDVRSLDDTTWSALHESWLEYALLIFPGQFLTQAEQDAFTTGIRDQYERQGNPYYATARLWDDGVIDPLDTRRVLGLALAVTRNAPVEDTRFGVFRM